MYGMCFEHFQQLYVVLLQVKIIKKMVQFAPANCYAAINVNI